MIAFKTLLIWKPDYQYLLLPVTEVAHVVLRDEDWFSVGVPIVTKMLDGLLLWDITQADIVK